MKSTNIPMATGVTTPIRVTVRPAALDKRDIDISIGAGISGTAKRTSYWHMECHPSWWWEFGPALVEAAILMSVEGVVPCEWPHRLDDIVKSICQQLELPLEEHHPGR